jgi:hypothetical protein
MKQIKKNEGFMVMTITRKELEEHTKSMEVFSSKAGGDEAVDYAIALNRLALEGLDARWRDCSVEPPPKLGYDKPIELWNSETLEPQLAKFYKGDYEVATYLFTIPSYPEGLYDDKFDMKIHTHWRYVTPPKTGEVK